MRIALAADHAGYALKEHVKAFLLKEGHDVRDFGTSSPESVDYPDYLYPAALAVAKGEAARGILVAGLAYAGAVVGNKVPGVIAAAVEDPYAARICREHGDANVVCLSGQGTGPGLAVEMVRVFLETGFLGGRYEKRNEKVREIERGAFERHALVGREVPREAPRDAEPRQGGDEGPVYDLVTEAEVRASLRTGRPLRAVQGCIVTPAARELLERADITIAYV